MHSQLYFLRMQKVNLMGENEMPQFNTKRFFAEKVLSRLPEGRYDKGAFLWGVQNLFGAVETQVNIESSYLAGITSVVILDEITLPYINWLTAELLPYRDGESEEEVKAEIEYSLDTVMIRKEAEKLPSEIDFSEAFPALSMEAAAKAEAQLSGKSESEILLVMTSAKEHAESMTDKSGAKEKLLQWKKRKTPYLSYSKRVPELENPDVDYANIEKASWEHNKIESDESFFELFDKAVEESVKLLIK